MKKVIFLTGMAAALSIACNNRQSDENEAPNTPEPVQAPADRDPDNDDGTSIRINEEGVDYESKSGEDKSKVTIGQDTAHIEIRDK